VDRILAREPEHPRPRVDFSRSRWDRRPFTLRRFLAPHWLALAGAFALVVLETVTLQAGPLLTQIAIDRGIHAGRADVVVGVALAYFGTAIVGVLATAARIAVTGRVGTELLLRLRVRIFSHLQRLSLDFFTDEKAGRLMTRMTSDIESLAALFHEGLVQLAVQALTLVVVSAVLVTLDPLLALVTILGIVPVMLVLTIWFRGVSNRGYLAVRERIAEVLSHLQESLGGIRIITAHNRRGHEVAVHRGVVGAYREANVETARVNAVYGSGSELVGVGGQALLLLVGGSQVLRGSLTIGELAAFMLYLAAFFGPIQQLVQLYNTYQQGQAAVTKLRDLLATEPSVAEAPDAAELAPIRGEIAFEGVWFAYDPGVPVLEEIDLEIAAGETFALVGPTGGGKSTIAKLVARFYDPTRGCVRIDSTDLRGVTLASLRRQLGVVPQEPFLFGGSIRDNIAFARPEASEEEVLEACRAVGLDDLVARLPEGLDTPCHERGVSLSSGERQLLALARAFLARPRVLVLDEATSSLDLKSESLIERALDLLLEGRTAILIAHRLATAMRADRIAVVDRGRIAELGSHQELVARGGIYAGMYATWERHAARAARAAGPAIATSPEA
jgi:ATP-binding cassette subfamily B protein